MTIDTKIKVHNRFDVTVCDAKTGEIKQTAVGFNVVTNDFFKMRLGTYTSATYPGPSNEINKLFVGTGTGTPAITDTALFNKLFEKEPTIVEEVYQYPTSYVTRQIVINADEYNGYTITEVGLAARKVTYGGVTLLLTHAMLQDSEGEPIAIEKTDTDVIYINAKFFTTYTSGGFGTNGIYPQPSANKLITWLLKGPGDITLASHRQALTYSSELENNKIFSKSNFSIGSGTGDFATLTMTLPVATILDTEWNNSMVKTFGVPGIGAFVFPDATAFPDYDVNHITIGEGDGSTTQFNIKCPLIKSGSAKVYVNSAELAANEYTVDYNSNCTDTRENYYTAGMNCQMSNVVFGDLATRSAASNYQYLDPLYYGKYPSDTTKIYPSTCNVSQANPIWIDFGEAKECNRLRIDTNSLGSYSNSLVIEYSNDNTTWTSLTYTKTDTADTIHNYVYSFAMTSARYWRVYVTGYTWNYTLYNQNTSTGTRDGNMAVKATFFLGRSVPGLTLVNPPTAGQTIEASYKLDVPFKTANNLLRLQIVIHLQRS